MIKTLFTLLIYLPGQEISFQMNKQILMPYLVREYEILEWGKEDGLQFFDVVTIFFNLSEQHLSVAMEPSNGSDWHYQHIRAADIPDIQAQLKEDGWVLI